MAPKISPYDTPPKSDPSCQYEEDVHLIQCPFRFHFLPDLVPAPSSTLGGG